MLRRDLFMTVSGVVSLITTPLIGPPGLLIFIITFILWCIMGFGSMSSNPNRFFQYWNERLWVKPYYAERDVYDRSKRLKTHFVFNEERQMMAIYKGFTLVFDIEGTIEGVDDNGTVWIETPYIMGISPESVYTCINEEFQPFMFDNKKIQLWKS